MQHVLQLIQTACMHYQSILTLFAVEITLIAILYNANMLIVD